MGTLASLDKFDNTYFGVSGKQAHMMDAQLRLLLEVSTEALLDAGINPADVRPERLASHRSRGGWRVRMDGRV